MPRAERWDEESFFEELLQNQVEAVVNVARDLLDWIKPRVSRLWWGVGGKRGGVVPIIDVGDTKYTSFR